MHDIFATYMMQASSVRSLEPVPDRRDLQREEIAGTLGLSVGDVCRLVSRSMKRLRRWRPGPPEE